MNKKINILLFSLLLASCDNRSKNNPEVPVPVPAPPVAESEKSLGAVELGPVKGASISILALDGVTLATAITDDSGYFSVDADELKSSIESYNSELKFVKVISTGGVDTDPNDDGVIVKEEQIKVKGNVSGIIPIATLYKSTRYRINFISTALVSILEDENEVSDDQIIFIIKRLGVPDLNEDGKVDIDDLTAYSILGNNSLAETILRQGYLEYVHSGDKEAQKLFIEELKYEVGFTRPLITKSNESYSISLSKTDINNTIYYGIVHDQNNPSFDQYNGETLTLNYNTAIYYQECSEIYGCYKLQKIFFYENAHYSEFDFDSVANNYLELKKITDSLKTARVNYKEVKGNREQTDAEIQALKDKISLLETKINSI